MKAIGHLDGLSQTQHSIDYTLGDLQAEVILPQCSDQHFEHGYGLRVPVMPECIMQKLLHGYRGNFRRSFDAVLRTYGVIQSNRDVQIDELAKAKSFHAMNENDDSVINCWKAWLRKSRVPCRGIVDSTDVHVLQGGRRDVSYFHKDDFGNPWIHLMLTSLENEHTFPQGAATSVAPNGAVLRAMLDSSYRVEERGCADRTAAWSLEQFRTSIQKLIEGKGEYSDSSHINEISRQSTHYWHGNLRETLRDNRQIVENDWHRHNFFCFSNDDNFHAATGDVGQYALIRKYLRNGRPTGIGYWFKALLG